MNNTFYLSKMPQELKARIEAEPVYAPWLLRGETLKSIWSDPAIMEAVLNQLSVREKQVLQIVVVSIGCEPFDWARLERLATHIMSGAEAKVGFIHLLKKGLIYMFRKSWGEHVYVVAEDALGLWQRLLLSAEEERLLPLAESPAVSCTGKSGPALALQLLHTLVFIAQNEMKLTKNGTLHKKQVQKWLDALPLENEPFQGSALKYAYADVYPVKLAVMMEFLQRLELVEQRGDQLRLREEAVNGWLVLNEREQNKRLYLIWKRIVFPGTAWLQHAALLLERQPEGIWLRAAGLLQWLRRQGICMPFEADAAADRELQSQLEQQWLEPLVAFGWLAKGTDSSAHAGGGEAAYMWLARPSADDGLPAADDEDDAEQRFYVQPDFEILMPPSVPYIVRWQLSAFADRIKTDQVSVYKLSKESLQRGLENGCRLEDTLQFLERHALYGLPDNVKLTLEQWAKPFGKVQLVEAVLLRCSDAEAAEAVSKLPGSAECLLEAVGDRAWMVRTDRLKRLTELLEKAGWMPGKLLQPGGPAPSGRGGISQPDYHERIDASDDSSGNGVNPAAEPLQLGDKGFLYSRHNHIYFEMDARIPEVRELYPDLQGVPQGWMRDYRTYHPSTRREMVEKALEWKTALQIRRNGRDEVIAPRKLQDTRGTWSMTGLQQSKLQEVCLFPEEWQEMKIIVPGVTDKY
ncbi:helicase-associated domain-containing protein [Paenibacillus piri]|nr:helicase-associated domain-containing protein [Paenibacillus piri]